MRAALRVLVLAAITVAAGDAGAVVIQTLMAPGDPVPGAPGASFEHPGFGAVGDGGTAFKAFDTSLPGVERLWIADVAGNLSPITHEGAAAPGTNGATFTSFDATPLAPGLVGVDGRLAGAEVDDGNDEGFWLWEAAGGLRLVAREGDVVPETNDARIATPFWLWAWTAGGELFAAAMLAGGDVTSVNDSVVLHAGAAGVRVFLREGDPAPGLAGFTLGSLLVRDYGEGILVSSSPGFASPELIYRGSVAGALEVVYAAGDPPPGIPDATFQSIDFVPTAPGQLPGFRGTVTTATGSEDGIWYLDANGELALAAREDELLDGGFHLGSLETPVVDGAGRVLFEGNAVDVEFDAYSSIFGYDPAIEKLDILARVETPIPCVPDAFFTGFFRNPFANARGDIAFWGAIEGVGIPRESAIYARLPDETVVVIAREQQSFEVTPGVFKTVQNLNLSNTSGRNALSDDGRLNFHLEFTDRTAALFVAHLAGPGDRGLLRARNSRASARARCAHVAPAMRSR